MKNDIFMLPVELGQEILPDGFSTPMTLPPQMPRLSEVVAEVKPEKGAKILMIFNFILSFLFGMSASSMVSMINAL